MQAVIRDRLAHSIQLAQCRISQTSDSTVIEALTDESFDAVTHDEAVNSSRIGVPQLERP